MGLTDRFRGIWRYGYSWYKDLNADQSLLVHLQKHLGSNAVVVRSVHLASIGLPIPLILVSLAGVHVIYPSALEGIFRVKNTTWAVMDARKRRYRVSRPNPVARTKMMRDATAAYLAEMGYPVDKVFPVLYFSHPGIHVDSENPAVRIVRPDAVERFITDLLNSESLLEESQVASLADVLSKAPPEDSSAGKSRSIAIGRLSLLSWQWLAVGLIILLEVCILITFAVVISLNA